MTAIVKSGNEDKENNIITFAKRKFFLSLPAFYQIYLFIKTPFTQTYFKQVSALGFF